MIWYDVLVVILEPGLSGTPILSNVDLTTFTEGAVNTRCFQAEVILDRLKETGNVRKEAYSFDVMSN